MHQGWVLSPLLFTVVLEALSREFTDDFPMELMYADDANLVLVAETGITDGKLWKWQKGMAMKGLRVNTGKPKVMRCQVSMGQVEDSGQLPCSVCRKKVGRNLILCVWCQKWVYKR